MLDSPKRPLGRLQQYGVITQEFKLILRLFKDAVATAQIVQCLGLCMEASEYLLTLILNNKFIRSWDIQRILRKSFRTADNQVEI